MLLFTLCLIVCGMFIAVFATGVLTLTSSFVIIFADVIVFVAIVVIFIKLFKKIKSKKNKGNKGP